MGRRGQGVRVVARIVADAGPFEFVFRLERGDEVGRQIVEWSLGFGFEDESFWVGAWAEVVTGGVSLALGSDRAAGFGLGGAGGGFSSFGSGFGLHRWFYCEWLAGVFWHRWAGLAIVFRALGLGIYFLVL